MKVYLVRPGENDKGILTSKGIWQIKTTARRFLTEKTQIDKIYVNGNSVSKQSGEILSKSLIVPVVSDERFSEIKESVILGNFSEDENENLEYVNLFVDEIVSNGKDVIISIGNGVHRAVISRLTGMSLVETRHFSIAESSVSLIESKYDGFNNKWVISNINDLTHLKMP